MQQSEELRTFLKEYKKYVESVLRPTHSEIRALLREWRQPDFWVEHTAKRRLADPSPIQRAFARIKRPESVVDKIVRRPGDFPDGLASNSFRTMNDAVGARIVVYFTANLALIDQHVRKQEGVEISPHHPPVAYLSKELADRLALVHLDRQEKESGYYSVHYIVRLRESSVSETDRPWFELQVRTLTQDVWAEVEQVLGYKPDKKTSFAVKRQFQIISSELAAIDEHFNFLHEELLRFQEETVFDDSDPLNAENVPAVLAEIGVGCAQREIDGIIKLLFSRGATTVGDLRTSASTKRLEIIRGTYRNELGRAPRNFEVVANLATIGETADEEEQISLIKAQIAYLDAWDELKKTFS